jgi:ribonuclease R
MSKVWKKSDETTRKTMEKRAMKRELTITGTLKMHPRGFGFVIPDDPSETGGDVFIPKHLTKEAIDGDRVEVTLELPPRSEKGPEGEIIAIVEKGRTQVAGIIDGIEKGYVSAHVPILGEERAVRVKQEKKKPLKLGDRVLLNILERGDRKEPTLTEVAKWIGHIDDPSCDIDAAILEYNLNDAFPKEALLEAKAFGTKVKKGELKGRLDLTRTPCFTIDPETAKDFDDALSITKNKKGHYFLGVHIADVAHYIPQDSALDQEAQSRSNSTYFPGRCVPMLPQALSNNLCSLRQGVIRLTASVLMEFDKEGTLVESSIHRAFIKSQKRFTYEEAKKVLEDKKNSPHAKALKQLEELCYLLKQKRGERGSIDFALPELILLVDDNGEPIGTKIETYHITHQIVEECMLKANEVIAKHLDDQKKQLLFRIHEEPNKENLEEFFSTARSLGFKLSKEPTQQEIQTLFENAKTTPFSHQLAVSFIRNLKLAYYTPRNVGHYGLALEHYCHFTSPIRRYSDLVTHRLLFDEEKALNLETIGTHCSERERISFRAEMAVKQIKKLRLLKKWQDEKPKTSYTARVTKIKPFGIYFEIDALFLEGFLHVSELDNEYFLFDPKIPMFTGEASGKKYRLGENIQVFAERIDLIHLETRWRLDVKSPRKKKK